MMDRTVTNIPGLEISPNGNKISNSWIVSRRETGEVIGEFYNRASLLLFNPEKVIIETAYTYLVRINKEIKNEVLN